MSKVGELTEDELTRRLTYAAFVLLTFELLKDLIVKPVKSFYMRTSFGGGPFKSYDEDVLSRHRKEFEACLLYLRDFMEAIDSNDLQAIQNLREHRNELAHDLRNRLPNLQLESYSQLFEEVNTALFKLSNYRTYMEIGSDPEFKKLGIDWDAVKGHEYLIFEDVLGKLRALMDVTPRRKPWEQ